MEKINVKVNQTTREVGLTRQIVGNQLENLQDELVFSFTDKFVDGQARLEYEIDNTKYWVTLDKINETYTLPLNSQITSQEEVYMQLVISVDNGIFKSNVFSLYFTDSINATTEAPEQYPSWIEQANEKLNQMDNINITANKVDNVATITVTRKDKTKDTVKIEDGAKGTKGDKGEAGATGNGISSIEKVDSVGLKTNYKINFTDGTNFNYSVNDGKTPIKGTDYYTEQDKQEMVNGIVTDANSDFNVNVKAKTNEFNSNAEAKTNTFNSNASSKVGEYNTNAKKELDSYNDNATTKLKAYNDNHTAKLEEYNNNSIVKVGNYNDNADKQVADFNTNVITKTSEYNTNATTKYNAYNTNDEEKLANYNSNDETKLKAYNDNHTTKLNEYNENATNKINEFDRLADVVTINKNISSNTKRIKNIETNIFDSGVATGELINIKDSALAEFQEIKSSINKAQETTTGYQLFDGIIEVGALDANTGDTVVGDGKTRSTNFIPVEPNTKYTFTREIGRWRWIFGYDKNKIGVVDGNFENHPACIINTLDKSFTFTTSATTHYLKWYDNNSANLNEKVMIEEGTIAHPYEPYTGGIASPNPDYPQQINTIKENWNTISGDPTSKNKLLVTLKDQTYNGVTFKVNEDKSISTSGTSTDYGRVEVSDYFELPEGNYFVSGTLTDKPKATLFFEIKYGGGGYTNDDIPVEGINVKINKGDKIRLFIRIGDANVNVDGLKFEPMVSIGKVPYEPYQSISTPNDLKGNEFLPGDNIIKRFNEEDGKYWAYLEKNMGSVTYKGGSNENWEYHKYGNYNGYFIRGVKNIKETRSGDALYCNILEKGSSGNYRDLTCYGTPNTLNFICNNFKTLEEWKTYISTNNAKVVYELENKQLIPIAPLDTMNMTYNPETNLFSSIGNIKIETKYYREFATTIRNMQIDNGKLQEQLNDMEKRIIALENRPVVVNEEVANA